MSLLASASACPAPPLSADAVEPERQLGADRQPRPDVQGVWSVACGLRGPSEGLAGLRVARGAAMVPFCTLLACSLLVCLLIMRSSCFRRIPIEGEGMAESVISHHARSHRHPLPLQLYDVRMQRELISFRGHNRDVTYAAWHPLHEELFVSGGFPWRSGLCLAARCAVLCCAVLRCAALCGSGLGSFFRRLLLGWVCGPPRGRVRALRCAAIPTKPLACSRNGFTIFWLAAQLLWLLPVQFIAGAPPCRWPRWLHDLLAGKPPGAPGALSPWGGSGKQQGRMPASPLGSS